MNLTISKDIYDHNYYLSDFDNAEYICERKIVELTGLKLSIFHQIMKTKFNAQFISIAYNNRKMYKGEAIYFTTMKKALKAKKWIESRIIAEKLSNEANTP